MSTEQLAQAMRKKIDDYHAATVARLNTFGNRGHYEAMEKENAEAAALDGLLKSLAAHEAEKAQAALTATPLDEAAIRADERERCAKLVEFRAGPLRTGAYDALIAAAAAIRGAVPAAPVAAPIPDPRPYLPSYPCATSTEWKADEAEAITKGMRFYGEACAARWGVKLKGGQG